MSYQAAKASYAEEIAEIKAAGLWKTERVIASDQKNDITLEGGANVVNMCANNYLGLANNAEVMQAASDSLSEWGFGAASVRFICGTQGIHKTLERRVSHFLGMEDTILYAACFDANTGLFETILGPEDAVISDELNHASIIDGVRLCKAARYRYRNNDMADLEAKLKEARDAGARRILITTDGVFSMDGTIAQLDKICDLAEQYDAMVMSDECHDTGVIGSTGRGTPEAKGVIGRVDILTGTFGKALGGGSGGFTCGPKEVIDLLRQTSRPYLFSNTLAPALVGASIAALEMLEKDTRLLDRLTKNTRYFRSAMKHAGFDIVSGTHPIIPIMLYDDHLAQTMASQLLEENIFVVGFSYPVVPKGKARIRVQMSAALDLSQIDTAVNSFIRVGNRLGVL